MRYLSVKNNQYIGIPAFAVLMLLSQKITFAEENKTLSESLLAENQVSQQFNGFSVESNEHFLISKSASLLNFREEHVLQDAPNTIHNTLNSNIEIESVENQSIEPSNTVGINPEIAQAPVPPASNPPNQLPVPTTPPAKRSLPPAVAAAYRENIIIDFPTTPAARLIGAGSSSSLSNPTDFGIQVLNGLNSEGSYSPTFAVDLTPYVLIRGNDFTLSDYRSNNFQRFLANTKLSLATSKVPDNNGPLRAAWGLEFMIFNDGDPRMDDVYLNAILQAQNDSTRAVNQLIEEEKKRTGLPVSDERKQEILQQVVEERAKKVAGIAKTRLEKEQQRAWTVGIGQSWASPNGNPNNLRADGMGFWTAYRQGLGGNSKLILHASTRNSEQIRDTKKNDGSFLSIDTVLAGARYETASENFRFSLETAYNRESRAGQNINDYISFGVGIEPRILDQTWLAISFGATSGRENGSDFRFMTNIKWNFNTGYLQP
jgi:hypothetical protein